jgi:hypothetical protein
MSPSMTVMRLVLRSVSTVADDSDAVLLDRSFLAFESVIFLLGFAFDDELTLYLLCKACM